MDISDGNKFVGWGILGSTFDVLYEGIAIPVRKPFGRKCVLFHDGGPTNVAFKLCTNKKKIATIKSIRAVPGYSGTFILKMLIQLCKHIGMVSIRLIDAALVGCGSGLIYLSYFKILTEGQTYYGKHGGFRANVENVDEWDAKCAGYVKQFQAVKLADYVANLQAVIDLMTEHDTIFTQKIKPELMIDETRKVLPDKSIIQKYETIIAKCSTSNREYLYQHMIDTARSSDYLELESTLYSECQIYSFSAEDGTQVCRDYIIPAIAATAMVGEYEYTRSCS